MPHISKFLKNPNGSKDVVIVLLGWAGAKDELLGKYVELYQSRGYDTIHYTAALPTKLWGGKLKNQRDVSSIAKHLSEALREKQLAIHCFSMNGVFTLCSLQQRYPKLDLFHNTKGIIFDSAPAQIGVAAIPTYMTVMDYSYANKIKKLNWHQAIAYKLHKACQMSSMAGSFFSLDIYRRLGFNVDEWVPYDFLKNHQDLPKVLSFVYSDADFVCPSNDIEAFAMFMRKRGMAVEELHLTDSDHVQHIRKYSNEYLRLVDRFLSRVQIQSKI